MILYDYLIWYDHVLHRIVLYSMNILYHVVISLYIYTVQYIYICIFTYGVYIQSYTHFVFIYRYTVRYLNIYIYMYHLCIHPSMNPPTHPPTPWHTLHWYKVSNLQCVGAWGSEARAIVKLDGPIARALRTAGLQGKD
jgi:hypothetical protein